MGDPGASAVGGTASRVADDVRERVLTGALLPGQRLSEEPLRAELGVARSTLREAFQLLVRERLLVHHLARGVFVRELTRDDVADLYAVRRVVECGALAQVTTLLPARLRRLADAVAAGGAASAAADWQQVAAASVRFHVALVGLAGSDRLDTLIAQVMGEFRLAYARMVDTAAFHEAFRLRNARLAELVGAGDVDGAVLELHRYLDDSEAGLLARYPR